MRITEGKRKGLEAVSNKDGIIGAAAMDQRGSLLKAIAQTRGTDQSAVKPEEMTEFKAAVTKVLTPYAKFCHTTRLPSCPIRSNPCRR
jgi:tagatose 1,6-diphosphate aldolase